MPKIFIMTWKSKINPQDWEANIFDCTIKKGAIRNMREYIEGHACRLPVLNYARRKKLGRKTPFCRKEVIPETIY